jgi:hypothetical protein
MTCDGIKRASSLTGTPGSTVPEMENYKMLGWMIVFALMTVLATVMTIAAGPSAGFISTKLAALVFGFLFLASVLTSLVRRRT